ncbi:MAG: 4a-hydroxytetrahydrobiopterin dehydratase [Candidatus Paceibacterota bacterium]
MSLSEKRCVACEGGVDPLTPEAAENLLEQVPGWELVASATGLAREFKFKDFLAAIAFVDQVADIAEYEGHHPNIHIYYDRVRIELTTNAISGLSENDFIVAAKISTLPS